MDKGTDCYRRFREEGDDEALAEIIIEYRDGLIFYLNSFVGDLGVAEELAEDTFVLLGTKKPRDKGTGSFKTWLYTIGRNIAINDLRKRARRGELAAEWCAQLPQQQTMETAYLQQEQKAMVHQAMGKLKGEYRQILWLLYFEDFTCREAAAVMRRSVHSAETLAYRARKALKAELEKEGYTHEDI